MKKRINATISKEDTAQMNVLGRLYDFVQQTITFWKIFTHS